MRSPENMSGQEGSRFSQLRRDRLAQKVMRAATDFRERRRKDELLLTSGEVASLFQVSLRAVRYWADSGKFSILRTPGGHRRYFASSIAHI